MRDACKGYEGCMRARQRGSGSHRLNVRRDVACVHTAAWRGWRGRDFRHRLPSWCAAAAWRGRRARLELVLWERAARLFGCYVAQSRKSAWGHVSLFWYAGATAPLKRMAPFQWATVRVHMTGRLHVSFGCVVLYPYPSNKTPSSSSRMRSSTISFSQRHEWRAYGGPICKQSRTTNVPSKCSSKGARSARSAARTAARRCSESVVLCVDGLQSAGVMRARCASLAVPAASGDCAIETIDGPKSTSGATRDPPA